VAAPARRVRGRAAAGRDQRRDEGERERRVESYVLDRDDLELYGVEVEVSFVARIRGMLRFDSVAELVATMAQDVARTRAVLGVTDPR
jgi:riboflavin kinase/FMN adenylyltransferase